MDDRLTASTAASRAVRASAQLDRTAISARSGLIAAIPVVVMLAVGTLAGQPVAAVTMGAGALLSGVAWRGGGGPITPPLGTMAAAAVSLTVATLAGSLSGQLAWLHLGLLAVFCLVGGLLTALGRRGGVVGVQMVIAFVVFGRFPEDLGGALTLAGLVLGGGVAQIGFAALVARPPTWRQQRAALAGAYHALATVAIGPARSNIPAADALDEAEQRLTGPALFADQSAITLSCLVQEGRRIRIELAALRSYERLSEVADRLREAGVILDLIASTIEDRGRSNEALISRAERLGSWSSDAVSSQGGLPVPGAVKSRLAALAGQLRAAVRLATQSAGPPGLRHVAHPTRGSRLPLAYLPTDLRRLRASATVGSATGRHAFRLAVAVTLTELVAQRAHLPRGYWAVIAAATSLRPEFGATFTRGAERILGTTVGVIAATLIVVALDPSGWALVGTVGLLAWVAYSIFPGSFAWGTAGLTAVIVFLLHPVAPDSTAIAFDRGIDTAVGGAIGVTVYLLWPTWSGRSAERLLADVVDAQRRYARGVLGALVSGRLPDESGLRQLARQARIAYSDAEAAVTLSRSEPLRGIEPGLASTTLVGLRRLVYAVHALRADLMSLADRRPRPELAPLVASIDQALVLTRDHLQGSAGQAHLPPLRQLYREAIADPDIAAQEPVLAALDELIDAVNTVASGLGLGLP
jgi:uncharacterized membrane protein YccC